MTAAVADARESVRMVRESAAAIVSRDRGLPRARQLRFTPPGFDLGLWREMCALGWPGLRVDEARGGTGLGVAELCAVAQALGAALAPEPFIAVAAAAPHLAGERLAGVLRGDELVVPAWMEHPHSLDPAGGATLHDGRVTGRKRMVTAGLAAHAFLVTTAQGPVLVERDAPGLTLRPMPLHDGGLAADLTLDSAPAHVLHGDFQATLEACAVAQSAYLLGAVEAAFDMTLAYLAVRRQFGKPIGSFQALQHRAVDLKMQLELTRAVVDEASSALDRGRGSPTERQALVSRAKMRAADAAMLIAKESIQFHGAIGMTDECDIGLYARKILTVHNDWGSSQAHRRRYTALEQARHD